MSSAAQNTQSPCATLCAKAWKQRHNRESGNPHFLFQQVEDHKDSFAYLKTTRTVLHTPRWSKKYGFTRNAFNAHGDAKATAWIDGLGPSQKKHVKRGRLYG